MCDFSAAGTDDFANPPIFGSQVMEWGMEGGEGELLVVVYVAHAQLVYRSLKNTMGSCLLT